MRTSIWKCLIAIVNLSSQKGCNKKNKSASSTPKQTVTSFKHLCEVIKYWKGKLELTQWAVTIDWLQYFHVSPYILLLWYLYATLTYILCYTTHHATLHYTHHATLHGEGHAHSTYTQCTTAYAVTLLTWNTKYYQYDTDQRSWKKKTLRGKTELEPSSSWGGVIRCSGVPEKLAFPGPRAALVVIPVITLWPQNEMY